MKKLLLTLFAAFAVFMANAATVYFQNPGSTVYAYRFGGGTNPSSNWDDVSSSSGSVTINGIVYYSFNVQTANVIFRYGNNKSIQTENLLVMDGAVFNTSVQQGQNKFAPIGTISGSGSTAKLNPVADYYLIGEGTSGGWDLNKMIDSKYAFTLDNGNYVLTLSDFKNGYYKIAPVGALSMGNVFSSQNASNQEVKKGEDFGLWQCENGAPHITGLSSSVKIVFKTSKTEYGTQGYLNVSDYSGGGSTSSDDVYLVGLGKTNSKEDAYKFTQTTKDGNVMALYVSGVTPNEWGGQNFYIDAYGKHLYSYANSTELTNDGMELGPNSRQDNNELWLSGIPEEGADYIFYFYKSWGSNSGIRVVKVPSTIYLYGNVDNLYWDKDIYYELKPVAGQPGVFQVAQAEVSGQWDENAAGMGSNRGVGSSTGNENYVAFFDHITGNFSDWKFGSMNPDNQVVTPDPKDEAGVSLIADYEHNNFKVAEGFYKVTLDLMNLNSIWEKVTVNNEKAEIDYTWFTGGKHDGKADAVKLPDENQDEHTITYTSDTYETNNQAANILQVGVENNPIHRAALQADYIVKYKPLEGSKVRALAADEEGFDDATNGKEYTTIGDVKSNTNHLIQLNQAGVYKIIATLHKDATGIDLTTTTVNNNQIIVTVLPQKVALAQGSDSKIYQKFSNAVTNDFEVAIDNTEIPVENINVTFVPNGTWDQTYEDLPENEQAEVSSMQGNIDGVYTTILPTQLSVEGEDGNLTVKVESLPCSGVYTMTLTSKNPNYTLNETLTVEVYPTVLNEYEQSQYEVGNGVMATVSGKFNVNGIHWTDAPSDYDGVIVYPIVDGKLYKEGVLDKSRIFTPGLYFADMYIYSPQEPVQTKVRMLALSNGLNDTYRSYAIGSDFDLSKLDSNNPAELYVHVSKNGASAPISGGNSNEKFQITASDSGYTLPTGVDTIGAEDGEAEYFNLQGVKVQNPEHGIYVKVQNGKAVKVVL